MKSLLKSLFILLGIFSLSSLNAQVVDVTSLIVSNDKQLLNKDGQQLFQTICDADASCGEYFVVGDGVIFGSFTDAQTLEAVIFGTICDNFCGIATKLFQFREGNWKVLYGHLSGDSCAAFKKNDQTDVLICQSEVVWDFNIDSEMPVDPRIYSYSLVVFEAGSRDWQKTTMVDLEIPMLPKCQDKSSASNELVYGFQFHQADVNHDGYLDATLDVEVIRGYCFIDSSTQPSFQQRERHYLVWLFDGKIFNPTESTEEFLVQYKLEGKSQ